MKKNHPTDGKMPQLQKSKENQRPLNKCGQYSKKNVCKNIKERRIGLSKTFQGPDTK